MVEKGELGVKWYSIFDWPLFFLVVFISFGSILVIYSANFTSESEFIRSLYLRQLEWNIYGLLALAVVAMLDYRTLERPAYLIYFIFLLFLVQVLMSGRVISGSQRWLSIAGMNIQPSELMKIVLVLTLARYFDDKKNIKEMGFKNLVVPAVIVLIPFALIAKQPDLGTAGVLLAIFMAMAFVNGIKKQTLVRIFVAGMRFCPCCGST